MEAAVSAFPALIFPLPWGGHTASRSVHMLDEYLCFISIIFIYFGENSFTCMRPRDIPHGTGKS